MDIEQQLAGDYPEGDPYRRAMAAADKAMAALPPEMWGQVMQIVGMLAASEALYQGMHGVERRNWSDRMQHNQHMITIIQNAHGDWECCGEGRVSVSVNPWSALNAWLAGG